MWHGDGQDFHCEGLTPWKQDGHSIHPEWDETDDSDWNRLRDLGGELSADSDEGGTWFPAVASPANEGPSANAFEPGGGGDHQPISG